MPVEKVGSSLLSQMPKNTGVQQTQTKTEISSVPSNPTPTTEEKNKNKKTPLVVAGVALAALGGVVYWKREALGLTKKASKAIKSEIKNKTNDIKKENIEKVQEKAEEVVENLQDKIKKFIEKFKGDAQKVLNENTFDGMVYLENIEEAAAKRSADLKQPNRFHQAASWIEEGYLGAYSRAELKDGKNMLSYIHNRIGKEKNTLAQIYAQMPAEEASIRLQYFTEAIAKKDSHTGTTSAEFIKDMIENIIPKAAKELKK